MSKSVKRFLFWTPRVICILFAIFISLFALDVFTEGRGAMESTIAFAMQMIPTAAVVIVLIISWRWEWVGAAIFIALGAFYLLIAWGKFPLIAYISISGPLFLMGILFLLNWKYRAELHVR